MRLLLGQFGHPRLTVWTNRPPTFYYLVQSRRQHHSIWSTQLPASDYWARSIQPPTSCCMFNSAIQSLLLLQFSNPVLAACSVQPSSSCCMFNSASHVLLLVQLSHPVLAACSIQPSSSCYSMKSASHRQFSHPLPSTRSVRSHPGTTPPCDSMKSVDLDSGVILSVDKGGQVDSKQGWTFISRTVPIPS